MRYNPSRYNIKCIKVLFDTLLLLKHKTLSQYNVESFMFEML